MIKTTNKNSYNYDLPLTISFQQHKENFDIDINNEFSELIFVSEGTALLLINSEEYTVKAGDVFVINGKKNYKYRNLENFCTYKINYKFDYLLFLDNEIQRLPGFQMLFNSEHMIIGGVSFQNRLHLNILDYEKIKTTIETMYSEYIEKHKGWRTILNSYFNLTIVHLSRIYTFSESSEIHHLNNITNVVSYIENNFTKNISIDELTSIANLSTRHFNRMFTKIYRTTPLNYINSMKMQHAYYLLKNTMLNISEIAQKCGYFDSNYFSRQFKKIYGISPKEFRNQNKFL